MTKQKSKNAIVISEFLSKFWWINQKTLSTYQKPINLVTPSPLWIDLLPMQSLIRLQCQQEVFWNFLLVLFNVSANVSSNVSKVQMIVHCSFYQNFYCKIISYHSNCFVVFGTNAALITVNQTYSGLISVSPDHFSLDPLQSIPSLKIKMLQLTPTALL